MVKKAPAHVHVSTSDYLAFLLEELAVKYRKVLSSAEHDPSRGYALEDELRRVLSPYLPQRYGLDTGFIRSLEKPKWISRQIDLIIWDKHYGCPLVNLPTYKVFPIESVVGVMEITGKASKAKLQEDFDKVAEVRTLLERTVYAKGLEKTNDGRYIPFNMTTRKWFQPRFFYFAFSSTWSKAETARKNIEAIYKSSPNNIPHGIYIIGNGYFYGVAKAKHTDPEVVKAIANPTHSFPAFISSMTRLVQSFDPQPMANSSIPFDLYARLP